MVIVVMGVSGSGKTVVGQALAARLDWAFEDADNWHPSSNIEKMRRGVPLTDGDREPWIRALSGAIGKWTVDNRNVVLACSALRKEHRSALLAAAPQHLRFVYLRGTYKEIDMRLRHRAGHFMPESLLKSQFAALQEPSPAEVFIVDSNQPVSVIVDSIIQGLGCSRETPGTA